MVDQKLSFEVGSHHVVRSEILMEMIVLPKGVAALGLISSSGEFSPWLWCVYGG